MTWQSNISRLADLLRTVSFTDANGTVRDAEQAFETWKCMTLRAREHRSTVYMVGNGASASMASHFAADLAKNAHVHTEVFSDLSLITAVSNDMGYEHVFAEPLRRRGKAGDMLVAISSSGESPNVLAAVSAARGLDMDVITVSAFSPENSLREQGTLNAFVHAETYGGAETCHAAILHYWLDRVVEG